MNRESIEKLVEASFDAQRSFFERSLDEMLRAGAMLTDTLGRGGKVLAFGNGGSAADAQHFAAELVGRYRRNRRALPAIALTTDTSALTAIANDFGFDEVFSRQVEALGSAGDMALAISTSGNSPNVLRAVETCNRLSIATLGLTGRDGGALAEACQLSLVVANDETSRIQEVHSIVIHLLCRMAEDEVCPPGDESSG